MRKFVLIALVALFAVAAAQEIADFKFKNVTHSNKTSNKSLFANKTGGLGVIVKSKNLTNPWKLVANKSSSLLKKDKNFTKNITAKISNINKPNRTVLPSRPNRSFAFQNKNTTVIGRPNRTFIGRPNKTNRTNKTKIGGLKSWTSGSGLEDEESSEATEDFSTLSPNPKNRTPRNRTFPDSYNKINKTNKTNKTGKAVKGGIFDGIKNWFFAEYEQEDEEQEQESTEDYLVKNKTIKPKEKPEGFWGKVNGWFGGKKNETKKVQPQKNNTNKTQPQKKNTTNATKPQKKNTTNVTQPQKKNTTNVTKPQKKNSSNKTQPQKKNTTTNVTQPQKKNSSNKTQPQKKNVSKKNETKKINQLELEDLAWNSDKIPAPGLRGSSLPPF